MSNRVEVAINPSKESESVSRSVTSSNTSDKSKAQLKAERRKKQEAQRTAKEAQKALKDVKPKEKSGHLSVRKAVVKNQESRKPNTVAKNDGLAKDVSGDSTGSYWLCPYSKKRCQLDVKNIFIGGPFHPEVVKLGEQCACGLFHSSNARSLALCHALRSFLRDFEPSGETSIMRQFLAEWNNQLKHLYSCSFFTMSMENVLERFTQSLLCVDNSLNPYIWKKEADKKLQEFVSTSIFAAGTAIVGHIIPKLKKIKRILIYEYSSVVHNILLAVVEEKLDIHVVLLARSRDDARGRMTLEKLMKLNLRCTYALISAAAYLMPSVDLVLMGAFAVYVSGKVQTSSGGSLVAHTARAYHKPLIICCESYKLSRKAYTDSLSKNELGVAVWRFPELPCLEPLALLYDFISVRCVKCLVTDFGMVPSNSASLVLGLQEQSNLKLVQEHQKQLLNRSRSHSHSHHVSTV